MTISVIIPTYNRSRLVTEAIDSVLQQTREVDEVIVVDDGSTDDTAETLRRYGSRITLLTQENRGVNAARNRGFAFASGSYVALLDSDDVWLPCKTELEMAALERFPGAGFVFSDFSIWNPRDNRQVRGLRTWHHGRHDWLRAFQGSVRLKTPTSTAQCAVFKHAIVYFGNIYRASLMDPFVLPSTAIVRRERLEGLEFDEADSTCGDWSFFSRLSNLHSAVFVAAATALNRSHEDGVRLTRIDECTQIERRIAMIQALWGSDPQFEKEHPGAVANVSVELLHRLARLALKEGRTATAKTAVSRARGFERNERPLEGLALWALARAPIALAVVERMRRMMRSRVG